MFNRLLSLLFWLWLGSSTDLDSILESKSLFWFNYNNSYVVFLCVSKSLLFLRNYDIRFYNLVPINKIQILHFLQTTAVVKAPALSTEKILVTAVFSLLPHIYLFFVNFSNKISFIHFWVPHLTKSCLKCIVGYINLQCNFIGLKP